MFRVLGRELVISLLAVAALALAAVAVADGFGPPTVPDWTTVWVELSAIPTHWTGPLVATVISTRWQLSDCRGLRSWNSSTSTRISFWSYRSTLLSLSATCSR